MHTTDRSRDQDTPADEAAAATVAVLRLCPVPQFLMPLQSLQDLRGGGAQLISADRAEPAGEAAAQRPAITTSDSTLHSAVNSCKIMPGACT